MAIYNKFLRAKSGGFFFAKVGIEIEPLVHGLEVDADIDSAEAAKAYQSGHPPSSWVDAAILGARRAYEFLSANSNTEGVRITIIEVTGALVDTTEDVVFCCAGLAVASAIEPSTNSLEAVLLETAQGSVWVLISAGCRVLCWDGQASSSEHIEEDADH